MDTKFWLENLLGRDFLKDLVVDEKIVLKWAKGDSLRECGLG
jgi:hypothetical protein